MYQNFRKIIGLIIVVVILSVIPRIWNLAKSPPVVVDEAANLRGIYELKDKKSLGLNEMHWDFHSTYLPYLPTILLINRVPDEKHLLLLRLNSVIYSLLALIPIFFLVKKHSDNFVAFLITILFSYNYYFLQFSRVGWVEVIFVLSAGLLLMWLAKSAADNQNKFLFAASGVTAGLMFYGYRAGIIYIISAFIYFTLYFLFNKKSWKKHIIFTTIFLSFFTIVALPWLFKIHRNFDKYNLRAEVVSIKNVETPYHGLTEMNDIYKFQIKENIKAWLLLLPVEKYGHESPRYLPQTHSAYNHLIKTLFWSGIIIFAVKFRQYKDLSVWILIIFLTIITGQVLTVDPPNGSRALVMMPSYFMFSAITLKEVIKNVQLPWFKLAVALASVVFSLFDFIYYMYWMSWIKV